MGEGTPPSATRSPPLDGLVNHSDKFQVDAFNRARLTGSTGKGLGKLLGFSRSPKPREPSPRGEASNVSLTTDDLLVFSDEALPTSLLKQGADNASRAVKMFSSILAYQGVNGDVPAPIAGLELIQKLLHQGLKRPELRDELYMQLIKQTRGAPSPASAARAWQVFFAVAACMPPGREFTGLVSEYVHAASRDEGEPEEVCALAARTWAALKRTTKAGQRRTLPEMGEIDALLKGAKASTVVYFLDETFEELSYDMSTTVAEAVEAVAAQIKLEHYQTFSLFVTQGNGSGGARATMDEAAAGPADAVALDDARYVADVLFEFRSAKARDGAASRLLFRKKMFRETDESVTEARFLQLSYIQAQHDYLAGAYPVIREDAAQLAALQLAAAAEGGEVADEAALARYIPRQLLAGRPREDWRADVAARLRALTALSKEEVQLGFLRMIRSLPYGNSVFFSVRKIDDPIGLLPARLILGINKRGVHFFRPVPKEYLHSAELRDIMQFGSSATAVFFKMRVAGVLHIFQFETRQGEEVCMALQTHINDIMMRRYSRAKAAEEDGSGGAGGPDGGAGFGPKYQAHVAELQRRLDEATAALAERDGELERLRAEREHLVDELAVLRGGEAGEGGSAGALGASSLPLDLASLNLGSDEAVRAVEARIRGAESERQVLVAKLARLEEQHAAELARLNGELDGARGPAQHQLREKDAKINELVEELGSKELLLAEALASASGADETRAELEELREFRADAERRERAQAEVVGQQAKRLEELDRLYREESVARKKAHNALEDAKGKIRVYCRVRPLLAFERERGQEMAVQLPDELTITLNWMDKKREFCFDAVFPGGTAQERVFEDTKHLIQSAVDGYNVCIFAYGQTGSGKTFTIYGNEEHPGLTPRGVRELFDIIDRDAGKFAFRVEVSLLELYCDDLSDLLADGAGKGSRTSSGPSSRQPKLDIKKDPKGAVTVPGATIIEVSSARDLLHTIESGLARRRVSSTAMNRESSRSHLIISISVEATNLQTQSVSRGKLSFVDLAGSERVKKSKSEGAQLKEAQAINKSLSALGNVIAALATEQAHVPYRDHKLTMLMSDSIGGTAKTLMFVNVSPVDANLDETNNSLQYATRVSTIRNDVGKNEANKDVVRLQKQVAHWKEQAGLPPHLREFVDLVDIEDRKQNGDE